MMYSREKAGWWKAFIPLMTQPPSESRSKLRRSPALSESWHSMAKLGGTAELFGPFRGNERLFLLYQSVCLQESHDSPILRTGK